MFDALIEVKVVDGNNTLFWTDRWLKGTSIQLAAPDLFRAINCIAMHKRMVQEDLQGIQWVTDVTGTMTIMTLAQYFEFWPNIQELQLQEGFVDKITWRWTSNKQYSARLAYQMFFTGSTKLRGASYPQGHAFHVHRPTPMNLDGGV